MATAFTTPSVVEAPSRLASAADLTAQARWENEGGATLSAVPTPTFFGRMFSWFRPPIRKLQGTAASSSIPIHP